MVNSKSELLELLSVNRIQLKEFGITQLGIFGSFVRDEANAESDIDFIVDFRKGEKTLRNLVGLGDYLENLTGRKVELVTRASLSPYIGPKILSSTEYVSIAA